MNIEDGSIRRCIANNPGVALQTYEWFVGDVEQRREARSRFLNDQIVNPEGFYPRLDNVDELQQMDDELSHLRQMVESSDMDHAERDAYDCTLAYRQQEIDFLVTASELNRPENDDSLETSASDFNQRSRELYGRPQPSLVDGVVGEIRNKFNQKNFVGRAVELHDEINQTLDELVTNSDITGLPALSKNAEVYLTEQISRYFASERQAVTEVRKIMTNAGEVEFSPQRMLEVFKRAISLRGYDGVGAKLVDDKLLSWSQNDRGVHVGRERASIESDDSMWGIAVHELGVHGQRFVRGQQSAIPILGNGLFVSGEDSKNQNPDYLSFEEGIAGLYQSIASGSNHSGWTMANFTHILNVALSEQGKSFRDVFEQNWKVRSLLASNDGQLNDDIIEKSRVQAYDSVFRIFRGTPMHRLGALSIVATYNKDLAYLSGKVGAIQFWNNNAGNDDTFDFLLSGKFDPNNTRHAKIARSANG